MNNNAKTYDISDIQKNIDLPNKEKVLALSDDEKLIYMDQLRIYYPQLGEILKLTEECHYSKKISERPLCMRIIGPSGSGKSSIVDIYKKRHPDIKTNTGTEIPVFYSSIPCPAHIGGLAIKLLHDLGDPFYAQPMKIALRTQRFYNLLRACKTEIIFLDEVQHLVDRNSKILLRDSSDWFKQLINETGIPIIFLGMPDLSKIFIENEQIVNRVRLVREIRPFEYNDTFLKFLYLYDISQPLKDISGFANPDLSKRIFIATKGIIKHMHDLFFESTKIALENKCRMVSMPILAQAYDKILTNISIQNPFLPGFDLH